jgi:hypothetical protein
MLDETDSDSSSWTSDRRLSAWNDAYQNYNWTVTQLMPTGDRGQGFIDAAYARLVAAGAGSTALLARLPTKAQAIDADGSTIRPLRDANPLAYRQTSLKKPFFIEFMTKTTQVKSSRTSG